MKCFFINFAKMSVFGLLNSVVLSVLLFSMVTEINSVNQCNSSKEKPCAARATDGDSVICVCNSTYCDEVIRETPVARQYVAYTSSKAGSRFRKSYGTFKSKTRQDRCITTLNINPNKKHQRVEGFGAAITDAAGVNIMSLPRNMQQSLINSYFSSHGNEYNMLRLPIGGTDFSTHYYAYNEYPENDFYLTNYTLSQEDYRYKIPIIKACEQVSTSPVHIVGSVWGPADWMISCDDYSGVNRLKDEFMQTYALYFLKFLELYSKYGIRLWAITTGNEPLDGVIPLGRFQHLGWSSEKMGNWIVNNLGPTIRNSSFKDIKILAVDDQRFSIPLWFNFMIMLVPEAEKFIDGIAVHAYADLYTPASLLKDALQSYPDKFVISTEASEGVSKEPHVALGSWERAEHYIISILEDLCNNVVGWIDWNMCLDTGGGPNWVQNYVDSAIIVNAEKQEFYKQPMFYALGQVSKFVKRDSYRLEMTNRTVCPVSDADRGNNVNIDECNPDDNPASYDSAAFQTPNNTIVVVIHNRGPVEAVVIKYKEKQATLQLEASSITTVEFLA